MYQKSRKRAERRRRSHYKWLRRIKASRTAYYWNRDGYTPQEILASPTHKPSGYSSESWLWYARRDLFFCKDTPNRSSHRRKDGSGWAGAGYRDQDGPPIQEARRDGEALDGDVVRSTNSTNPNIRHLPKKLTCSCGFLFGYAPGKQWLSRWLNLREARKGCPNCKWKYL